NLIIRDRRGDSSRPGEYSPTGPRSHGTGSLSMIAGCESSGVTRSPTIGYDGRAQGADIVPACWPPQVRSRPMPIPHWTRGAAGIFHHFHHGWIEEIARSLNRGLLPADYYALAEQFAAGLGPDVLTLHAPGLGDNGQTDEGDQRSSRDRGGGLLLAPP